MPATTAHGFPYPLGTDRVMDGDDAIHNLAQMVDDRLGYGFASGEVSLPAPGAAGTTTSLAVTFPVGLFTVAPRGFATVQSSSPAAFYGCNVGAATASGMTVYGARLSGAGSAILVNWLAHGK